MTSFTNLTKGTINLEYTDATDGSYVVAEYNSGCVNVSNLTNSSTATTRVIPVTPSLTSFVFSAGAQKLIGTLNGTTIVSHGTRFTTINQLPLIQTNLGTGQLYFLFQNPTSVSTAPQNSIALATGAISEYISTLQVSIPIVTTTSTTPQTAVGVQSIQSLASTAQVLTKLEQFHSLGVVPSGISHEINYVGHQPITTTFQQGLIKSNYTANGQNITTLTTGGTYTVTASGTVTGLGNTISNSDHDTTILSP